MNFTAKTHLKMIRPSLLLVLLITCAGLSIRALRKLPWRDYFVAICACRRKITPPR
jgi:hypothetical protein